MPPKRKACSEKIKAEPIVFKKEEDDQKDIRDYLDPRSVSLHLFCSICHEVYDNPHRAPCGHSYCKSCIVKWLAKNKTCPEDRKSLVLSKMHHDFILENIIMDQKVACPYRCYGCLFIQSLSTLNHHLKECKFDPKSLPDFLMDEMSRVPKDEEKCSSCDLLSFLFPTPDTNKQTNTDPCVCSTDSFVVRDGYVCSLFNFSAEGEPEKPSFLPLKMRLFQAGGLKRDNLVKVFDESGECRAKIKRLVDLLEE